MRRLSAAILAAVAFIATLAIAVPSRAQQTGTYEIRITNLMRAQIMSPPVVAAHAGSVTMFLAGQRASDGLAALAEDGDPSALAASLAGATGVTSVAVGDGAVLPGVTQRLTVTVAAGDVLSVASMLVTTNDTFVGVDRLTLTGARQVVLAPAYDAGTEVNSEDCDFIPGPPCGSGGMRDTRGAERHIYISTGIQGEGDVGSSYDWRNPAARIVIVPMQ